MGFLKLSAGKLPQFKKATFSLWFNVPAASLAAIRAGYNPDANPLPMMSGILPIILFGPRDALFQYGHLGTLFTGPDQLVHDWRWNSITHQWDEHFPTLAHHLVATGLDGTVTSDPSNGFFEQPLNPGFIGIDCSTEENLLTFRFPWGSDVVGTAEWAGSQVNGYEYPDEDNWYSPISFNPAVSPPSPPGAPPYNTTTLTKFLQDLSPITVTGPEMFAAYHEFGAKGLSPDDPPTTIDPAIGVRITPNVWHHVLLSVDFTTDVSVAGQSADFAGSPPTGTFGAVNSTSKVYLSYDNTNKTDTRISQYAASAAGGGGPNEILTPAAYAINAKIWDTSEFDPVVTMTSQWEELTNSYDRAPGLPTYEFSPPDMDAMDVYIPGDSGFTKDVRMAELQIWTGIALDTSVEANRRLFIKSDNKPEKPSVAAAALGPPKIALTTKSKNWRNGTNRGTAGNLSHTGTIDPFTPGP